MGGNRELARQLIAWYERAHRKLPWRETKDPYRIWLSEVMLQQTRVAAALPYYERFLARFPDVQSLANATEQEVLALWSGLGYYSRARNMMKAAREMAHSGGFSRDYEKIRALPGIGDYTAAAVASLAFGLPHAVVDGNVARVLSRVKHDAGDIGSAVTRKRLQQAAGELLDRKRPGLFNQAMMELGATLCLPKDPRCLLCPISSHCEAFRLGVQRQLPVKLKRGEQRLVTRKLLLIRRDGCLLLRQRAADESRMAGFWELPEAGQIPGVVEERHLGEFRHSITNTNYTFSVVEGAVKRAPKSFHWISDEERNDLPLSTTARKALTLARRKPILAER